MSGWFWESISCYGVNLAFSGFGVVGWGAVGFSLQAVKACPFKTREVFVGCEAGPCEKAPGQKASCLTLWFPGLQAGAFASCRSRGTLCAVGMGGGLGDAACFIEQGTSQAKTENTAGEGQLCSS